MERADVIIVGGGLIGCAAAWRLSQQGAAVVLIEAGELNAGASGQNAGSLHFQLERRFLENDESVNGQAAQIATLNLEAVDDWRGLENALGTDLHVTMAGGLMVAETSDQVELLELKASREQALGLASRIVDGNEARRIAPYLSPSVLAACHLADEGHADPKALTPALARAAQARGARIATGSPVTAIDRTHEGFAVTTAHGRTLGRQLLLAAGAWNGRLATFVNIHLPIVPVALLMNATERVSPVIPHLIQHVGRRLSLKQAYAGNILIGGGWPSRLRGGPDGFDLSLRPALIPASLAGNLRAAIDVVPSVARLNLVRSWTGVTAISTDQLPIVGEVPRLPGFWVAGGGSAFTLGPTFARLLAAAMGGSRVEVLDLVSPARFEHLNSFMG